MSRHSSFLEGQCSQRPDPILANEDPLVSAKPRSRRQDSYLIGGRGRAQHRGGQRSGWEECIGRRMGLVGGEEEGFMERY